MISRTLINGLAAVVIMAGVAYGGVAHARARAVNTGVTPSAIDICRSLGMITCCNGDCADSVDQCPSYCGSY